MVPHQPARGGATMLQNVGHGMMIRYAAQRPACALAHCRELMPLALALGLLIGTTNSSPVSGRSHRTDVSLGGCDGIRGCPAPSSAHLARPAGLALRVARPVATARSGV